MQNKLLVQESIPELEKKLLESKRYLFNLRCDLALDKLKNTSLISNTKKKIARLYTTINIMNKLNSTIKKS